MKPPDAPNPAGWRPCHWRSRLIGCALVLVGWLPAGGVWADGSEALGWARFTEENNNLGSNNDRYYVNGFEAGYLSQPLSAGGNWASRTGKRIEDALGGAFGGEGVRDQRFD